MFCTIGAASRSAHICYVELVLVSPRLDQCRERRSAHGNLALACRRRCWRRRTLVQLEASSHDKAV